MKKIVIDLDGTLTIDDPEKSYIDKLPQPEVVETLRRYKDEGFEIIVATARNMRTYSGNVGKINANTLPVVLDWLRLHDIPFDEIHIGKPWCGHDGFYVDDKAIRPDEFTKLSYDQITSMLGLSQ